MEDAGAVGSDGGSAPDPTTVRERVRDALDGDTFLAAVRRQTRGTPSYPSTSEDRYEDLGDLPADPFDQSAVRTELLVFSEAHVYRWTAAGGTVDRTRLPRDPEAAWA